MKKLTGSILMGCAMLASTAQADTLLYSQSKAGGAIVLMMSDGDCITGREGFLTLGAKTTSEKLGLCWYKTKDDIIVVNYDDGDRMEYPLRTFRYLDTDTNTSYEIGKKKL